MTGSRQSVQPTAERRIPGTLTRVRVLESFRCPRSTTNPYIVQLAHALAVEPGCELLTFSYRRAIFGSYSVFHVHWPEVLYAGNRGLKGIARELLFAMVLARIQFSGTPIVRTRHNVLPHEPLTGRQRRLDDWLERLTTAAIGLNAATEVPAGMAASTILHGDYHDWFSNHHRSEPIPGRIAYFGLIRPYKGVESLLDAFLHAGMPDLTLSIAGRPATQEIHDSLLHLAGGDERVGFTLRHLSDAEVVTAVTEAELVVLPYTFMHNSGAALAALSLNRPLLLPDNAVNRLLQNEVGPGWVQLFDGGLTPAALDNAIGCLRAHPPVADADLSARSWQRAGVEHMRVFNSALKLKTKTRARTHRQPGWETEAR